MENNKLSAQSKIKIKTTKRNRVADYFEIEKKIETANKDMCNVGFFYQ